MNSEESALLNLIKAGNVKAFEKLFNSQYITLCIYARKIVGDTDEARDIVQNVFISIYDKRKTLEINTSIRSYLLGSVYHACLNHLNKIKTHQYHHDHLKSQLAVSDNQDTLIKAELEEKIWTTVQNLPDQCRRIFKMNRFEGKKNSEIAEALGISIRTVETQISKALKILRKDLINFLTALLLLLTAA